MKETAPNQDFHDDASSTGLPWLTTWKSAYTFVVCSFVLWLALLIALTELSA